MLQPGFSGRTPMRMRKSKSVDGDERVSYVRKTSDTLISVEL